MKKIVFIIGSLSGSWAEQFCVKVANNFANNAYKVEFLKFVFEKKNS